MFAVSVGLGRGIVDRLASGGFTVRDGEAERTAAVLEQAFGVGATDVVVAYRHPGWLVDEPAFMAELHGVASRLEASAAVVDVRAPLRPGTPLSSKDDRIALVVITVRGDDDHAKLAHFPEVVDAARDTVLHAQVGGRLAAHATAQTLSRDDLVRAELVALPLVFGLLLWLFRSVVAALIPVVIAGVSIEVAMLVLRGLTTVVDVSLLAMNVVTFLGVGLAVDYSLFVVLRFREELRSTGGDVDESLRRTTATSGRTVLFSGVAVAASLLGLLWFRIPLLESIAIGGTSITVVTLLVTLVFLPGLLALLGPRIEAGRLGAVPPADDDRQGRWYAIACWVMRRPWTVGLVVVGALLVVASPVRRLRLEPGDASLFPARTEVRQVADLVTDPELFATGELSTIDLVAEPDIQPDALGREPLGLAAAIQALPGVSRVDAIAEPGGDRTYLRVVLEDDASGEVLVDQIRALPSPGGRVLVGGDAALDDEIHREITDAAPAALATVAAVTFVVLLLAFGSLVLPLKALVLNGLSVAASYGALVWVFQDGRLESLLRYESPGALEPSVLAVTFAVVFGLSMDYEMFLLSRIREEYLASGDDTKSVARGLGRTGRLITGAAAVLVAVVIGFVAGEMVFIKELGVGLGVAVLVDATIVRGLLVPASMAVLGKHNWWAPRWLARWWARAGIGVEE
ncbi:MMPL family transporter [Paraliomyxa miuraensis]|nr:MMPL family transporter [Paraliomyxa miuraensis]